jgi:hypothetical protein
MICLECATAGDANRKRFEMDQPQVLHPEDCGCACMHKPAEEWEKQFGGKPPWVKKVQETEVL